MATVNVRYTVDDVNTVDHAGNLIELFQPVAKPISKGETSNRA